MRSPRRTLLAALTVIALVALAGWTVLEARRQRQHTETVLTEAANLLARALGPGLVAASAAVRELDEIVTWKLLDNSRLLAELELTGPTSPQRLELLTEENGLDTVAFLDALGTEEFATGPTLDPAVLSEIEDVLRGRTEELVLGSSLDADAELILVAVARSGGGAVVVGVEASAARTFARRLGVENLLGSLAGTEGVLYLAYQELPQGLAVEASWDGGPVPPASDTSRGLRPLRGRSAFEAEMLLEPFPGRQAALRVGLDGAPLERASAAAMRRTLLVGVVLVACALAAAGFALVNRLRAREREQAARRLADAEAARQRSERLAAAGALTAGLAHEVRSPMNAIGLAAQRLERKLQEKGELQALARRVRREVVRLETILREFLELASPVSRQRKSVDLGALGREVCDLLGAEAEECEVVLEPPAGSASVDADSGAIRRAMINLVRNAVQASPAGGRVSVAVTEDDEEATVSITDEGTGVDPDIQDRIFDAFVTGRPSGTGLGLALVRRVAEEHGGIAALTNRPSGGAEALLRLPRTAPV
jgi:signal transduction histidine kinase